MVEAGSLAGPAARPQKFTMLPMTKPCESMPLFAPEPIALVMKLKSLWCRF
jgi:hypothetical protein